MNKEETVEAAAKRILANNIDGLRDALNDDDLFFFYKGVIECYGEAMVEWKQGQQKNKFSEEDVKHAYSEGGFAQMRYYDGRKYVDRTEWFEQFKTTKNG
jgi:hypothetical protein